MNCESTRVDLDLMKLKSLFLCLNETPKIVMMYDFDVIKKTVAHTICH